MKSLLIFWGNSAKKRLAISKQAVRTWERLDAKQFKQVGKAIVDLLVNSRPHDSQAMKGAHCGERRVDVGEYRIVYADSDELVEVLVIGKRNDDQVYKVWQQK